MDEEFDAKFYPVNKDAIRKKLAQIGAKLMAPERKMRRVIFDSVVNPQVKGDYVRVRDEGGLIRLSLKIHAREGGQISDQKEIDIEVSSFDKTIRFLEAIGLKANRYQETLRETWQLKEAEVVIDTWPGLEPYIEIESNSEEGVKTTAARLGFDWRKGITRAIVEIYMDLYGLSAKVVLEKVSDITFEKNPFSGMKRKKIFDSRIYWGYNQPKL